MVPHPGVCRGERALPGGRGQGPGVEGSAICYSLSDGFSLGLSPQGGQTPIP